MQLRLVTVTLSDVYIMWCYVLWQYRWDTLNWRQGAGSPALSIIRPISAMYFMFSSYFSSLNKQRKLQPTFSFNYRVGILLSIFSSRWNWESPNPSPARECAPPPPLLVPGGRGTLAGWVGESQFRLGDIHRGTLYMYVICGFIQKFLLVRFILFGSLLIPVLHWSLL